MPWHLKMCGQSCGTTSKRTNSRIRQIRGKSHVSVSTFDGGSVLGAYGEQISKSSCGMEEFALLTSCAIVSKSMCKVHRRTERRKFKHKKWLRVFFSQSRLILCRIMSRRLFLWKKGFKNKLFQIEKQDKKVSCGELNVRVLVPKLRKKDI